MKTKKIAIDVRTVSQGGGVATYIEKLVPQIINRMPDTMFYLFITNDKSREILGEFKNAEYINLPIPKIFLLLYDWVLIPLNCLMKGITFFHGPKSALSPLYKIFRIKTLVTIHDVIPLTNPETEKFINKIYWNIQIPLAYKLADAVVTDSNYSKDELVKRFGIRKNIETVYLGIDINNNLNFQSNLSKFQKIKAKFNIKGEYILYVGTIQPRKNILNLIKAFELLNNKDLQLVIAGRKGWLYNDIFEYVKERDLGNHIIFTDFISAEEIQYLYKNAKISTYISITEGFGFPIIEAMSFKIPVITSNTSCMPEIAGNAAILVNPRDIMDISKRMEQLCTNNDLRNELVKKGIENIKRFSWDKCTENTLEMYHKLLTK